MTKKLKDRLLAVQGFRRRAPRPPKKLNFNWQPNEERISAFYIEDRDIARGRSWSDWLAQFEEVVRRRGAAALPFPVDGKFRTALRNLVVNVSAMESIGVHFRPAGTFALRGDLVDALTNLRWCVYQAAWDEGDGAPAEFNRLRLIAFADRARRDLKIVLAAVKIAWPLPSATCQSAAHED